MFFPPKSSEESTCSQFLLRYGKTNKKCATCLAALLQNKLDSNVAGFTTQGKTLVFFLFVSKTGPNVGGNM